MSITTSFLKHDMLRQISWIKELPMLDWDQNAEEKERWFYDQKRKR